jgi:hypothetical protein
MVAVLPGRKADGDGDFTRPEIRHAPGMAKDGGEQVMFATALALTAMLQRWAEHENSTVEMVAALHMR